LPSVVIDCLKTIMIHISLPCKSERSCAGLYDEFLENERDLALCQSSSHGHIACGNLNRFTSSSTSLWRIWIIQFRTLHHRLRKCFTLSMISILFIIVFWLYSILLSSSWQQYNDPLFHHPNLHLRGATFL